MLADPDKVKPCGVQGFKLSGCRAEHIFLNIQLNKNTISKDAI